MLKKSIICISLLIISDQLLSYYVWPVHGRRKITSVLAEYRGIRGHQGLDMSTHGKKGVPIRSANHGYVSSIMYQHWGIGYAVFVKHADGYKTFYGHLSRFHRRILRHGKTRKVRWKIRNKKDFRIYYKKNDIPIRRGQTIAYSGDSGIGPIHLHFELRKNNVSVNPLVYAYRVRDRSAPKMLKVHLVPLDGFSHVDGLSEPAIFRTVYWGRRRYGLKGGHIPVVAGRVGVKVKVYDRAGYYNKVALYGARTYINNKLVYSFRFNKLSRKYSHRMGLFYDREYSTYSSFTYYMFSRITKRGIIRTHKPGKKIKIKVEVFDASGNKSRLYFTVKTTDSYSEPAYYYKPNLLPGMSAKFRSKDRRFSISFNKKAALYKEMIKLSKEPAFRSGIRGLTVLSDVYGVTPWYLCLDKPAVVRLKYNKDDYKKVGIYGMSKAGSFFFLGRWYNKRKNYYAINALSMQKFFLMKDERRPTIRFRKHRRRVRRYRPLKLYVSDYGTGVDFRNVYIRIDGKKVNWDYEIDKHYIEIFKHNRIWRKGRHSLYVQVRDLAGNKSRFKKYYYYVK